MTSQLPRTLVTVALGAVTSFGLFWVMQRLISVDYKLDKSRERLHVDFVRLRRDTTPQLAKREPPRREKPEQAPPPPAMNMAKAMNPSDAVGEIIPIVDTSMQLEEATSLAAAGGSDSDIVPLVRVEPEYPPRAKQQGIEGWVELQFTITPAGTVEDAVVTASKPSYVFDQAALRAVRKWRYNPRVENGVAVARSGVRVRIRFEIPRGRR